MFGFMIVDPAGLLLGALVGELIPLRSGSRRAVASAISGAVAALFATWESLAFLAPDISLQTLLFQLALPAAAICFSLGVIGTYTGTASRHVARRLVSLVVETTRSG